MRASGSAARRVCALALYVCFGCGFAACTWQEYAVSRGIRTVTGARTQLHCIVPITTPLRTYRVIETQRLRNLAPGTMPSDLEEYLNDALDEQLRLLAAAPTIVHERDPAPMADESLVRSIPTVPTLAFGGFIDDYDPGYIGLRLVELGFNHMVVTVRIRLLDKSTGQTMGAASITAQDNRVTATSKGTIDRLAHRVARFLDTGDVE